MKFYMLFLLSLVTVSSIAQNKITYLKMQRTACFGRCKEYTVTLNKNGDILWEGKKNVALIGKYKAHIEPAKMKSFFASISKNKWSTVKPVYKPTASDLPHINFTLLLNGKTKGIKNADAGPEFLNAVAEQVDSLYKSFDWQPFVDAQNPTDESSPSLDIQVKKDQSAYVVVEQEATFPGGPMAMMEFVRKNIIYPETAKEAGIEGKVICNFVIGKDGNVKDVKVMKGIGYGCNEEAIRILQKMPKWQPAKTNGYPVETHMNIPIDFKLK